MRSYRGNRCAVFALLVLGAAVGCRHKAPPPPPAASAPPITPSSITVITPLPSVPADTKADVKPAPPEAPPPAPAPVLIKPARRERRKLSAPPATAPKPEAVPAAAPAPPKGSEAASASVAKEAEPALGQLAAGTAISDTERTRMLSAIQQQETRLAKVKATAASEIETLQMQVRAFLTKARQAVAENDLDGAQTLNTKARVLLDEMQPE